MRILNIRLSMTILLAVTSLAHSQRINENLVVLYDFSEGEGNIVHDRGPSLGVAGEPIDLFFDPSELSSDANAGQFGDRPGLISWGNDWLNINKDHPIDDGIAHGTPDAAVIWDQGPNEASKLVDRIAATGQFSIEAWIRPMSIDNRSNTGRIIWMTVEGPDDASNFALGQQSCCDGGGLPGGFQVRLNTETPDKAERAILNSDGFQFDDEQLLHIVYTHDTSTEESKVFLNREGDGFDSTPIIDEFVIGEDLEGWEPDYVLAIGNDPYRFNRWFGGELHLIAIHDQAFSVGEIQQHFEAGATLSSGMLGDFDNDGDLDIDDLNALSAEILANRGGAPFDLNNDGNVDNTDHESWVKDLKFTWFGDSDLNGEFNSGDFVAVFTSGKFEQEIDASWADGDWNNDGRFNSGDFVKAFTDGGFEQGPRRAAIGVPEPTSYWLLITCVLALPNWLNSTRRRLPVS